MEKHFAFFFTHCEVPLVIFNRWHNLCKVIWGWLILWGVDTGTLGRLLKIKNPTGHRGLTLQYWLTNLAPALVLRVGEYASATH
jgi:hypothetical protein